MTGNLNLMTCLKFTFVLVLFFNSQVGAFQRDPALLDRDRLRLAEAFSLNNVVGDHIWTGWSKVPFAVLLVTRDFEYLIRHPEPSKDFTKLGYDSLLQSDVYYRKRSLPTTLLATFPAVQLSLIPTVVIGQAENTEAATSTRWVITLFHEHFHQLQYSQPTYYQDVGALNLAHGDETGMWMLNYPFPYTTPEVQNRFADLSGLMVQAINSTARDRDTKLASYLQARKDFSASLNHDDYKYLAFEFWQEGIARYTEYRVAGFAATKYKPTKSFQKLSDFKSFKIEAAAIHARILNQLLTQQLSTTKREVVYPFGAAEGLLLDKVNPSWMSRYWREKFDLGPYFSRVTK